MGSTDSTYKEGINAIASEKRRRIQESEAKRSNSLTERKRLPVQSTSGGGRIFREKGTAPAEKKVPPEAAQNHDYS